MDRREGARARAKLHAAVRSFFADRAFEEVETPCLVPAPGMEPHIDAFAAPYLPEGGGEARPLWLHTSPEYAMKRLLARGFPRIFQLARVFRNGEVSASHNPEFTMLEFYRAETDYQGIMRDLEDLVEACALALVGGTCVRAAGRQLDLAAPPPPPPTAAAGQPVYVVDWPAPMAALSKVKGSDARFAERFELYAGGLELANGFTELTDAAEQRRRLEEERALRGRLGRPASPLDERFLEDLSRMPEAGGVAVGLDRLLMLLVGARSIDEVLLFPAREVLGGSGPSRIGK